MTDYDVETNAMLAEADKTIKALDEDYEIDGEKATDFKMTYELLSEGKGKKHNQTYADVIARVITHYKTARLLNSPKVLLPARDLIYMFNYGKAHGLIKPSKALIRNLSESEAENKGLKATIEALRMQNASMFNRCPKCGFTNDENVGTVEEDLR